MQYAGDGSSIGVFRLPVSRKRYEIKHILRCTCVYGRLCILGRDPRTVSGTALRAACTRRLPRTMPLLDRTVWLTHLPVGDNLTGKPFSLTDQARSQRAPGSNLMQSLLRDRSFTWSSSPSLVRLRCSWVGGGGLLFASNSTRKEKAWFQKVGGESSLSEQGIPLRVCVHSCTCVTCVNKHGYVRTSLFTHRLIVCVYVTPEIPTNITTRTFRSSQH